ncbi:universal stress protein [Brevibacterium spongiae]|uniref:Universal stress protein n=1 Tax=Brevibacterium spongiae TaxID=2909672 RepID=A0ABY5ST67_9MICO|nr:universal stress protein [Brevibacterium spongiae]UVI36301.1 universal stress protein [Brevibacterium spongiae]
MSIVVGIAPGQDNQAAIELGIVLARTYGHRIVATSIDSAAFPMTPVHFESQYEKKFRKVAEAALDDARALIPSDIESEIVLHTSRSSRRGLLEMCEKADAYRLVVGPSADGKPGRIGLGSVSNGLLHSARLPVALAPSGYRAPEGATLERITAAYSGSTTSANLILGAAMVSAQSNVPFRIASFAPRSRVVASANVPFDMESSVVDEWTKTVQRDTDKILCSIEQLHIKPGETDVVVGTGVDWAAALTAVEWQHPEVMMLGSSGLGALKRVSLGSHAMRILQNSPVPIIVVPRRAKADYIRQQTV